MNAIYLVGLACNSGLEFVERALRLEEGSHRRHCIHTVAGRGDHIVVDWVATSMPRVVTRNLFVL